MFTSNTIIKETNTGRKIVFPIKPWIGIEKLKCWIVTKPKKKCKNISIPPKVEMGKTCSVRKLVPVSFIYEKYWIWKEIPLFCHPNVQTNAFPFRLCANNNTIEQIKTLNTFPVIFQKLGIKAVSNLLSHLAEYDRRFGFFVPLNFNRNYFSSHQ